MSSRTYALFAEAMHERKQIFCTYQGFRRELCPIVLGHTNGREKALTYQFGGESSSRLPKGGAWKCLFLAQIEEVELCEGPWYAGDRHDSAQSCVEEVDFDVNPDSPYEPRRRLLP